MTQTDANGARLQAQPAQHHIQHTGTRDAFSQGVSAGDKFGEAAAPIIVLAIITLAGWIAYRVCRLFIRWTQ